MKTLFDPANPLIKTLTYRAARLKPVEMVWSEVVGDSLAQLTHPVDLDSYGKLTVWADSSLPATTLRHSEPSIVAKFKSRGMTQVRSLQIKVAPSTSSIRGRTGKTPRTPVSSGVVDLLQSTAESLIDPDLKKTVFRLSTVLKRRSGDN